MIGATQCGTGISGVGFTFRQQRIRMRSCLCCRLQTQPSSFQHFLSGVPAYGPGCEPYVAWFCGRYQVNAAASGSRELARSLLLLADINAAVPC